MEPADFGKKRWEKASMAKDLKPVEALKAAIRDIESGECKPGHLMIIYTSQDPELHGIGWYQAGDLSHLEQVGLCAEAMRTLGKADD